MDTLLTKWKIIQDEMTNDTVLTRAGIETLEAELEQLRKELAELELPFRNRLANVEAEIRAKALALGKTYKAPNIGVEVAYRKGATRVTYDWKTVDAVCSVLRDIAPATAAKLASARSETHGEPTVKIELM